MTTEGEEKRINYNFITRIRENFTKREGRHRGLPLN
jgi:hypothetical protein